MDLILQRMKQQPESVQWILKAAGLLGLRHIQSRLLREAVRMCIRMEKKDVND